MRRLILLTVVTMLACMPGAAADSKPGKLKRLWIVSAAVLGGATFLDAHTSYGKLERNPLMRDGNGQFSPGRGIAVKAGLSGSLLLIQALLNRNTDQHYKTCIISNFASAGVYSGVSIYNLSVPRSAPLDTSQIRTTQSLSGH